MTSGDGVMIAFVWFVLGFQIALNLFFVGLYAGLYAGLLLRPRP